MIAVIAGGKSSRMGTDKSFVLLRGKPIIEHVIERMRAIGEPFLVTNRPDDYAYLGLRMVGDVVPEKGALGGIHAAIYHSPSEHVMAVACDMPFVEAALLQHLYDLRTGYDVVVPRVERYPQGLYAVYSKGCLPHIESRFAEDRLKVIGFYDEVRVRYLDEPDYAAFDATGRSFFNVNTPEQLEQARQLANS